MNPLSVLHVAVHAMPGALRLHALLTALLVTLLAAQLNYSVAVAAETLPHVVFIAGKASHGYGEHEHNAGGALLVKDLNASGVVRATLYRNGWPSQGIDSDADTVVLYMDGDGGHEALEHMQELSTLMDRGTGLVAIHFATHVPHDVGESVFLDWLGAYYNSETSTNPHWRGKFRPVDSHPISRGVRAFEALDEFYFNLRFTDKTGLRRVLVGTPPDKARQHIPHPRRTLYLFGGSVPEEVRENYGRPETISWAFERENGGRSFGFTGGHYHWNWGNAHYRKLVLNGIVWSTGVRVPAHGVPTSAQSVSELEQGLDSNQPWLYSSKDTAKKFRLNLDQSTP